MAVPVSTWCRLGVPGLVFLLTACSPPGNEGGAAAGGSQAGTIDVTPDVVYGHKAGMALTFDVYRPPEANGAGVLFLNSGGFVSGKFRQYESAGGNRVRFTPADSLHLEGETEPIPLLGTLVDDFMSRGVHEVRWDGRNASGNPVSSGIYFVNLKAPKGAATTKVSIVR